MDDVGKEVDLEDSYDPWMVVHCHWGRGGGQDPLLDLARKLHKLALLDM